MTGTLTTRRHAFACGTEATRAETQVTAVRLIRELKPKHNAAARLTWYLERVRRIEPAPLGKRRCRDPKDDPCLAAALASRAKLIVTYDRDRLVMEKPFGITIVKPSKFLLMV